MLAARLARESAPIPLTPARQVVLVEAALLWCQDLVFPTARRLAQSVDRAPSTVLNGFETMVCIHAEIIRREWDVLRSYQSSSDPTVWVPLLISHVEMLNDVDRALVRLSLVSTAVSADAVCGDRAPIPALSVALDVAAAFADPATDRRGDWQLSRLLRGVMQPIATEVEDVLIGAA